MIPRINMPAGELFDLIRPVLLLLAALISTWVLASARKRFPIYVAFGWAVGTLFLLFVVLPAYLAVILLWGRPVHARRWRFLLPLAYGVVVIFSVGLYFYFDSQSVDAHLARANQAKLIEDRIAAIREYRHALALEDNPHTHKLLAIELANDGQLNEASSEFRLAEQGGETISCTSFDARCEEALKRIKELSR